MTNTFALVDKNNICINVVLAENASIVLGNYDPEQYSVVEIIDTTKTDNLIGYPYPPQETQEGVEE